MDRVAATPVLKKLWNKIPELEKIALRDNRPDLFVQTELMRKQCIEIMNLVKKNESSKEQ